MNNNLDDDNKVRPGESGIDYWKRINGDQEEPKDEPPEQYWNGFQDNGPRPMNDPDYGPIPEEYRSNGMSRAAMICGIIALAMTFFLGGGFLFALLAILFAFLSAGKKMSHQARIGLVMGTVSLAVFVFSMTTLITTLVSNGSWNRLMEEAREIDFSDSTSVAAFQAEIYEAFIGSNSRGSSEFGLNPILDPQNSNIDAGIRARENAKEAARAFAASTAESAEEATVTDENTVAGESTVSDDTYVSSDTQSTVVASDTASTTQAITEGEISL